mgnify:FL=1|jgi:hypothetical protein
MDEKGDEIMVIPYQYMRKMAMSMPERAIIPMSRLRYVKLIPET